MALNPDVKNLLDELAEAEQELAEEQIAELEELEEPKAAEPKTVLLPPAKPDLLAEILAEFGKKTPKGKGPKTPTAKPKAPSDDQVANSVAEKFHLQKTGYKTWLAVAKIVVFQERTCTCCGETHTGWVDEMYKFSNGRVHGVWIRHEAYSVEHPELLPVEVEHVEPRVVSACPSCIESPTKTLELVLGLAQRQMELPL